MDIPIGWLDEQSGLGGSRLILEVTTHSSICTAQSKSGRIVIW